MDPARWERIQQVFAAAVVLPVAEQQSYVRGVAEDAELRDEVLALLEASAGRGRLDSIADGLGVLAGGDSLEAVAPPPRRVGPYAVVQAIAHGGMGSVYLAERADGQLRYRVALKLLRRDLDAEELRQRFLAERQILARINHPNIARLLDGGITEEGRPYFVMEYVEGLPLDQYCDASRLAVAQRLELFRTVCAAVQHAHRNLVVHRDLKSANILVAVDGTVKLLDFGIAKVLDPEAFPETAVRTRTGLRLITPEYASPEQLRGEPVTTASDVYQLGLLLYELLTGCRPRLLEPSPATSSAAPAMTRDVEKPSSVVVGGAKAVTPALGEQAPDPVAIAQARGTTPQRLRRQLAGDLDNIVLRSLREEPERRYASVEQLAEDVRRHLVGLPILARPETFGYLATKFVRRHRAGVAASVAIAVLLVAFGVGMALQAKRVARERDRAQQVSDLLLDLFRSASPEVSRGDTITVVQVLDRGAERVRSSLGHEPALQATMLGVIADAYRDLGQLAPAAALAKEALALRLASLGPNHHETIRNVQSLAEIFNLTGQQDSGLAYAEWALELGRRQFGRRSLFVGEALQTYSFALQQKANLSRARPALEEAVGIFRAHGDSGRARLASALVNLAWMDQNRGNLDSAEARMRESIAIRRAVLEPDHPDLANSLSNLADLLLRKGNVTEAEQVVSQALTIEQKIYPRGHTRIAASLALQAKILASKGDLNGAEQRYREALAAFRGTYGDRHVGVANALNELALFLRDWRGDLRSAEASFREAASIYAEKRGATDAWTAVVLSNLATAIYLQGRYREAEAILRGAIPALEAGWSPTDARLGAHLVQYGMVLTKLGRHRDAEPLLRRALDTERGARASGDRRIARAQAALGACLVEQHRFVEAEPLLLAAHHTLAGERGVREPLHRVAADALVKLYTLSGRPADAARYRGTSAP